MFTCSHLNTPPTSESAHGDSVILYVLCLICVCSRYREVCSYKFRSGRFSGATGHFTQVVWKGSTQLGVGFARGSYSIGGKVYDNCLFVVGRYLEPGNMMGAFQENVLKGSFNRARTCNKNPGNYGKRNELFDHTNEKQNDKKKTLDLVL